MEKVLLHAHEEGKKFSVVVVDSRPLLEGWSNSQLIWVAKTDICLQAYSIPVKLKYECPAPSKFGKDLPLWKTATTSLLQVVKECGPHIQQFGKRR